MRRCAPSSVFTSGFEPTFARGSAYLAAESDVTSRPDGGRGALADLGIIVAVTVTQHRGTGSSRKRRRLDGARFAIS